MNDESPLPRFRKPPVSEVAVGVQFTAFLTPVQLGLYYQRIKTRFPKVKVLPPIPPTFETFGETPSAPLTQIVIDGTRPRMWFLSEDESFLIQLQTDKLFLNWRGGIHGSPYPHFEAVQAEFAKAYDELEALVEADKQSINVNQCETIYINPILRDSLSEPQRIFRVWSDEHGPEWQAPVEDLAFNARYRLNDEAGNPFGRLTVTLVSGYSIKEATPSFQLELTARGVPRGPGRDGVAAFHDHAHKAIVRCFAAITTPEMHKLWERSQ
jgi:uncharacterized protein (TIGR04255 family)